MKKLLSLFIVAAFSFIVSSCSRESPQEEELTPLNAAEKYGEVMGRSMKKAASLEETLSLRHSINLFAAQEGRYPYNLKELVDKGYIKAVPESPEGLSIYYDSSTGAVEIK